MANKLWSDLPYGFDRTQGFKEYTQPIITRTTALTQTMELVKLFNIEVSVVELFNLQKELYEYIETGETKVFKTLHTLTKGKFKEENGI
jgi:hypothetical protein